MPEDDFEKRFVFNAGALALAARIRHPDDVFVNGAAPSHLPVTGGLSESTVQGADVQNHQYKDVITFTAASSTAKGDFLDPRKAAELATGNGAGNDLPTQTLTRTRLDGFRLNLPPCPQINSQSRVFHATTLELSMESTSNRTKEPISFRSLVANFGTITLATGNSAPVELRVQTATQIFGQCDTKQKLMDTYTKDDDFRRKYGACFFPPGAKLPGLLTGLLGRHQIPHANEGPILATFVTALEWVGDTPEGTRIDNNRLTISGLGTIYFGEILIDENRRHSTLLRFELGPCVGGETVCCDMYSNGGGFPPVPSGN